MTEQAATPPLRDRYRGCLLGGAVGDALGAPIEFWTLNDIRNRYGSTGVTDFLPAYERTGGITDDTQMTLFTAEGLLRGLVRGWSRGMAVLPAVVDRAYLRWLLTQGLRNHHAPDPLEPGTTEWLFSHEALRQRRAPGNTCLSSLLEKHEFGEPAQNHSKGCGGVMRVAPIGLYGAHALPQAEDNECTFKLVAEIAGLTHGHPTGQIAAGALAVIISEILQGSSLPVAITIAVALAQNYEGKAETVSAIALAMTLAETEPDLDKAIQTIGAGWIAEEALAIALYTCLRSTSVEQAVTWAANHGGDSDSTAAIAGNIAGAIHGVEGIPGRWLEPLELREVITEVADDLFSCPEWPIDDQGWDESYPEIEWVMEKYPGC